MKTYTFPSQVGLLKNKTHYHSLPIEGTVVLVNCSSSPAWLYPAHGVLQDASFSSHECELFSLSGCDGTEIKKRVEGDSERAPRPVECAYPTSQV